VPERRHDQDRAGDRGREHLQARHPLFRAARGQLPGRGWQRATDRHGLLRDRPGADEAGISWPRSIAPFDVHLVGLGKPGSAELELAERLYRELAEDGFEVLYDDRDASPGEKFVEAELLGCPLRVVAGRRSIESGELEVQLRRGVEQRSVPLESATESLRRLWSELA